MTKYLEFEDHLPVPPRRTMIVHVLSVRSGAKLAEIKWYGAWHQFAFYPEPGTIWNPDCLREINDRIALMTRERGLHARAAEKHEPNARKV